MDNTESKEEKNCTINHDRRKTIKKIAAGLGLLTASSVLPEKWIKPLIGQTVLPAHAQTSGAAGALKIVALGDSIGARSPNWPNVVESKSGITVSNYSEDSLKTGDFVGRVASILDSENPSHLMILLGTNNARSGSVSGAISDLQTMARIGNEKGVVVIIGTIPPNLTSSSANANAEEISNGIYGISNIRVAEVRSAMGDGDGLFNDGIHPNSKGTDIIADAFVKQLY